MARLSEALLQGLRARGDSARLRLAVCVDVRREMQQRLAALETADRQRRHADAGPEIRAATDAQWAQWLVQRRKALNAELARARAAESEARHAAQRAFGRQQAADRLAARQAAQAHRDRARRQAF